MHSWILYYFTRRAQDKIKTPQVETQQFKQKKDFLKTDLHKKVQTSRDHNLDFDNLDYAYFLSDISGPLLPPSGHNLSSFLIALQIATKSSICPGHIVHTFILTANKLKTEIKVNASQFSL